MLAPVAIPSSTKITVLPRGSATGPSAAVGALPPVEFDGFPFDHLAHLLVADAQVRHHIVVHDDAAAAGQRTHRQFRPPRHAQLPDQEHVQLRMQSRGDLPADRNAAAGQPEDQ